MQAEVTLPDLSIYRLRATDRIYRGWSRSVPRSAADCTASSQDHHVSARGAAGLTWFRRRRPLRGLDLWLAVWRVLV
jgi:hypothetical protein